MITVPDFTQAQIRHLLHYEPDTGTFTWRNSPKSRVRIGDIAGCTDSSGYRQISISGKKRLAHRLAWLYVHGYWPTLFIDHINGIRDDNRLANLRECTNQENKHNLHVVKGVSSHMGVSRNKASGSWQAKISVNNRSIHLGCFESEEAAASAYQAAKAEYHPSAPKHGATP